METILITAGGTGGHVMPALALCQKLDQAGKKVILVTDERGQYFIPQDFWSFVTVLPLPRYKGTPLAFPGFCWGLIKSLCTCIKIFHRFKVKRVIGFGGYVTLPPLLVAIFFRRSLILHEQNAILGRVNRLFGFFAEKIAISTPDLMDFPKQLYAKLITAGLPVRNEIEALRDLSGTPDIPSPHPLRILVIGGSQGAQYLNQLLPQALSMLSPFHLKQIEVHHQCGKNHYIHTEQAYANVPVTLKLKEFFEDMAGELHYANLVLARAGASTIAEVSLAGKAAFFIPYPHAMDDHQTRNAQVATGYGGGWWQSQSTFTPGKLALFLRHILQHPQVLQIEGEQIRRYGIPDATSKLAHFIS